MSAGKSAVLALYRDMLRNARGFKVRQALSGAAPALALCSRLLKLAPHCYPMLLRAGLQFQALRRADGEGQVQSRRERRGRGSAGTGG